MRLTKIDITNAIGCRRFAAELTAPITLVAGPNGAGKTSLIQAVRLALTGEMPRVSLKKDAGALVSEGAKTGSIAIDFTGGKAVVTLPDCKLVEGQKGDINMAMPLVCDMHRFSSMQPNERRTFMFGLTGTSASTDEVRSRLIDRKADPGKVDAVLPLLRSGFPAACEEAKGKARDAKASWRTITGEAYGDKKAEGWKAEKPQYDAAALATARDALGATEEGIEAATARLGDLNGMANRANEQRKKLSELREKAGRYARIQDKLNRDEKERDEWKAKVEEARAKASGAAPVHTLTCPCCQNELVLKGDELVKHEAQESTRDPEAAAKLPEYERSLQLMERSVENGRRDLEEADVAAKALAELQDAGFDSAPDEAELLAAQKHLDDLKQERKAYEAGIRAIEDAERDTAAADKKTAEAARYHADVQAWDLIADALAPDGIPGELLSQALKPINHALAQASADTGWLQVTLDAEMAIRGGGRPYALLSESEQWRADAMLTAAIAQLSGLKLMLLDRMDVLDIAGRGDALGWIATMAEAGEMETCIVGATLKEIPQNLPGELFQSFWISGGEVERLAEAA